MPRWFYWPVLWARWQRHNWWSLLMWRCQYSWRRQHNNCLCSHLVMTSSHWQQLLIDTHKRSSVSTHHYNSNYTVLQWLCVMMITQQLDVRETCVRVASTLINDELFTWVIIRCHLTASLVTMATASATQLDKWRGIRVTSPVDN